MKKIFLLLAFVFPLCSCADAEFYDDPSDGFANEDSVSDAEMSEKPRYMYAIGQKRWCRTGRFLKNA